MASLLADLLAIGSNAMSGFGYCAALLVDDNSIISLMFGISFLGACIGIFGRLLNRS